MPSDKAEHDFKLASRLKGSADCTKQKQLQGFVGVIIGIRPKKAVQTKAYAFLSVPLQAVQKITDRMIAVFVGYNQCGILDFLLNRQAVVFFKVEKQIFNIHIGQSGAFTIPTKRLYNVGAFRQQIFADSTFQQRVILKYRLVVHGGIRRLTLLCQF